MKHNDSVKRIIGLSMTDSDYRNSGDTFDTNSTHPLTVSMHVQIQQCAEYHHTMYIFIIILMISETMISLAYHCTSTTPRHVTVAE